MASTWIQKLEEHTEVAWGPRKKHAFLIGESFAPAMAA